MSFGFDERTAALLIAGKTIDGAVHHFSVTAIKRLAARVRELVGNRALVVPSTDLRPEVKDNAEEPAYCRVAIGVPVAVALASEQRPGGPLELEQLREGVRQAAALPRETWDAVATELAAVPPLHSAAIYRGLDASGHLRGVVLDAAEALDEPCALHFITSGLLPAGQLVYGAEYLPDWPADPEDRLDSPEYDKLEGERNEGGVQYFAGTDQDQQTHPVWVRGVQVAHANFAGLGSQWIPIDDAAHSARVKAFGEPGGAYWLVPAYD